MKVEKEYPLDATGFRLLKKLEDLQAAFADFTKPRWFHGYPSPHRVEAFCDIISTAKGGFWMHVYGLYPFLRSHTISATGSTITVSIEEEDSQ